MIYIYVDDDNNFGFKDSKINEILETDIKISSDIYNKFFEEQAKGKQFTIKNINGITFEEIFQEFILEPADEIPVEPSQIEKLEAETEELKKLLAEQQARSMQAVVELTNLILATKMPQA